MTTHEPASPLPEGRADGAEKDARLALMQRLTRVLGTVPIGTRDLLNVLVGPDVAPYTAAVLAAAEPYRDAPCSGEHLVTSGEAEEERTEHRLAPRAEAQRAFGSIAEQMLGLLAAAEEEPSIKDQPLGDDEIYPAHPAGGLSLEREREVLAQAWREFSEELADRLERSETVGDPVCARTHWSQRGIYALLEKADPALRDELLLAWQQRDDALAASGGVPIRERALVVSPLSGAWGDDAAYIERACAVMHDAYEAAAVGAGWETQAASRKPWADVPEANKATMRAAVEALLDWEHGTPAAPVVAVPGGQDAVEYHPDPEINAEVIETAIEAERADLAAGFPPRMWRCPDCRAEHGRGHLMTIGQHRCLACGYVGTGGVMFGSNPGRSDTSRPVVAVPGAGERVREALRAWDQENPRPYGYEDFGLRDAIEVALLGYKPHSPESRAALDDYYRHNPEMTT